VIVVPRGRNEDYIKRVVALPGDRIAVVHGQIILNGKPVPQVVKRRSTCRSMPCARPRPLPATACAFATRWAGFLRTADPARNPAQRRDLSRDRPQAAAADDYAEVTVPAGHVFLMGDNRDHSADSREPLALKGLGGPVPLADVGGRAEFVTVSLDGSETVESADLVARAAPGTPAEPAANKGPRNVAAPVPASDLCEGSLPALPMADSPNTRPCPSPDAGRGPPRRSPQAAARGRPTLPIRRSARKPRRRSSGWALPR
jgi:signal peptidase I